MGKLKAVKPEAVEKRLKLFMFGGPGSGKTTAAIQFPSPYLIDTERGAENEQYVTALKASGGLYLHTSSLDEIIEQVLALMHEKHSHRTLIIDPLTVPYNNAADEQALAIGTREGNDGTAFGRHKQVPDRIMRRLASMLYKLDMNVILTSHEKIQYKKLGDNKIEAVGNTFDCYGKLDYIFDLVLATEKRGMERVAIVKKSRIASFPEGEVFPLSYAAIAERYGKQILERGAEPVELASAEQVARLTQLVDTVRIDAEKENAEIISKWLDKADAGSFAEMPADAIEACIKLVEKRIAPTPATAAKETINA